MSDLRAALDGAIEWIDSAADAIVLEWGGDRREADEIIASLRTALAATPEPTLDADILNRTARGLHTIAHRRSFEECGTLICADARRALAALGEPNA